MDIEEFITSHTVTGCQTVADYCGVEYDDLVWDGEQWTIDGMDPVEWREAINME